MSTRCLPWLVSSLCFLVSSLPHAHQLRNQDVEAWFVITFLLVISVVESRVDSSTRVSWILLQCALRLRRPVPICWRGDETHSHEQQDYKTPLQITALGDELTGRKRMHSSFTFVFRTGMYNHCISIIVRDTR